MLAGRSTAGARNRLRRSFHSSVRSIGLPCRASVLTAISLPAHNDERPNYARTRSMFTRWETIGDETSRGRTSSRLEPHNHRSHRELCACRCAQDSMEKSSESRGLSNAANPSIACGLCAAISTSAHRLTHNSPAVGAVCGGSQCLCPSGESTCLPPNVHRQEMQSAVNAQRCSARVPALSSARVGCK